MDGSTTTYVVRRWTGPLSEKHGVYMHMATMMPVPYHYEDRLIEAFPGIFERIRLFVFEPYDLALSKLSRNAEQDIEDVKHLARTVPFDLGVLRKRYQNELRPYLTGKPENGDLTIQLWVDAIGEEKASSRESQKN